MNWKPTARFFAPGLAMFVILLLLAAPIFAQSTGGSVTVNAVDQAGAQVPAAAVQLRNVETNDMRKGQTHGDGTYIFAELPFGVYELTVSKTGFDTQVFQSVQVQTARATTVNVSLKIGGVSQTVTVAETATPVIELNSTALSDTIDTKQVVNLPMQGRNVMSLAFLVPGWSSTSANSSNGTWNNMPGGAVVSADFDGTPGISNRFRSGGFNYGTTAAQPRIEDVGEMTISTGQLDLSGTGTSAMRIAIVTRHGTNDFHGRIYDDFRNTDLNANSWLNNARGLSRSILKLNDFGASVSGPIIKNKLFFFGTYAQSIQPSSGAVSANVLTPSAQSGIFSYKNSAGAIQSVDLFQIAGAAGAPAAVNSLMGAQLAKINGVLNLGTLTPTSDPNFNSLNFQFTSRTTVWYPTIRTDYVVNDRIRLFASYAQTLTHANQVNNPQFPGGIDPLDYTSNVGNSRIGGFGVDWTIKPTLLNQFHGGYMYQYQLFDKETLDLPGLLPNLYETQWSYGQTSLLGGAYPRRPISSFYPLLSWNDNLAWQYGKHSFSFGAVWYREQDHYWNGPGGEPNYSFNMSGTTGDPLSAVFTSALNGFSTTNLNNAQNLYAELTGRASRVSIAVGRPLNTQTKQFDPFGAYNLDEVQASTGLWAQDSWRFRPNLTINLGLRWDFVGDDYDVNGGYSTLPSIADLWGPTPVGRIFQPGTLGGVSDPHFVAGKHAYNPSYVNPSPAIALAWSPQADHGWLGKLTGGKNRTVIRTGYSLRHYAEGAQNFWAFAADGTNGAPFFFQQGSLTSNPTTALGNFAPGSIILGGTLPPYFLTPAQYSTSVSQSSLWPSGGAAMNPNIRQPYLEQWNFGVQRGLGAGSAIEIRYVGNLALHQWLAYNLNEVNVVENGFLNEFKNAQNNLNINVAAGKGNTFANNGLPGQVSLPIFQAAFLNQSAASGFGSGSFITNLKNGAAGSLANSLATNTTFFCNMVGTTAFPACTTKGANFPATGAFPINFWEVNPFATGGGNYDGFLDAAGMSDYHGMQVEFRQRVTHGAQFNVNYTWAHSLGIAAQNGIQGQGNNIYYTDRNFKLNYSPSLFDIRQVVHASGTYDLPLGRGHHFLSNANRLVESVAGGWTLGTILTMQSGTPGIMGNGFNTFNNNDSGVYFNGITAAQVQSNVGVFHTGNPWVYTVNPSLIAANGTAATSLQPANTPGVFGYRPYLYGPHWFNDDFSINKSIPIRERIHATLQAEFLNLTNHPAWNLGSLSVQSTAFGQVTNGPTTARRIELRANIEF